MKAMLTILAWNVYIGNTVDQVRRNLFDLIQRYNPEIIVLMEASHMYSHLDGMGYKVLQLMPKSLRPGSQPGQGNIAILVRNEIKIKKRITMRMKTFWLGPKHGWLQDPRVYRAVKFEFGPKVWKVGGAHVPFGAKAREETCKKLRRWFRIEVFGRPKVLVLDANMHIDEFNDRIAKPGGAMSGGVGVDLIGHKNTTLFSAKDVGHHGSDHPAMVYQLLAK